MLYAIYVHVKREQRKCTFLDSEAIRCCEYYRCMCLKMDHNPASPIPKSGNR